MFTPTNIAEQIWVAPMHVPTNAAAGTITGTGIDRMTQGGEQGWLSAVVLVATGVASGTPTSYSVTTVLEESDSSGSGYAAIASAVGSNPTALTADSTVSRAPLNLLPSKRYIRAVTTVAFVGGTSPAVPCSVDIVFGGPEKSVPGSVTT